MSCMHVNKTITTLPSVYKSLSFTRTQKTTARLNSLSLDQMDQIYLPVDSNTNGALLTKVKSMQIHPRLQDLLQGYKCAIMKLCRY